MNLFEKLNRLDDSLVESDNLSASVLSALRDQFKNRGYLRIGNKGVRFISKEDDFAQYMPRDTFNKYVYDCLEKDMSIEDIADDIPWEETIGVHHASEIPEYNSNKKRLNIQYGFTQERTPTSHQNHKERFPKTTFTDLKKQGAPIVPYVNDCMTRLNSIAYKKSVKVLDYNTCVIQVTTLGEGLADVENAVKPVEKTFPGTIITRWGKDTSDWRLSRFNVEIHMLPEGMNESKRVAKQKKLTESVADETEAVYDDDIDEMLTENRNNPYFAPYGYKDAAKVLNGKAPEYYYHLKEIEMDRGDGIKLARYALRKDLPVMVDKNSNPDYPKFAIKGEYHWNDYFYPYPTAHEENLVAWDGKMFVEEQLTEGSYDPYTPGKYGDLIFEILDSCSGDAIIHFMHEYGWPFYASGDSMSDVYDKINKYLDTHSGYGLWSDLNKYFN